jgi:rubrerythrin
MKEFSTDYLNRHYIDGMKRLVAISKNSAPKTSDAVKTEAMPVRCSKNICLICGYMWDSSADSIPPKRCPSCSSTLWNDGSLKRHKCKQCSHVWMRRLDDPLICPSCRSKLWNKDAEKLMCVSCGHNWLHRKDKGLPQKCLACSSADITPMIKECICEKCGYSDTVEAGKAKICPICRSALSIVDEKAVPPLKKSRKRKTFTDIGPIVIEILGSDTDNTRKILEIESKAGVDITDAEILVRFSDGEDQVSIARSLNVSLDRVIRVTISVPKGNRSMVNEAFG